MWGQIHCWDIFCPDAFNEWHQTLPIVPNAAATFDMIVLENCAEPKLPVKLQPGQVVVEPEFPETYTPGIVLLIVECALCPQAMSLAL